MSTLAAPTAEPAGIWKLTCPGVTAYSGAVRVTPFASVTCTIVPANVVGKGTLLAGKRSRGIKIPLNNKA
jgi:hypothetical protein